MDQPTLYTERLRLVPPAGSYDELIPGAEHGEVEYELTRATWQRRTGVATGRSDDPRG